MQCYGGRVDVIFISLSWLVKEWKASLKTHICENFLQKHKWSRVNPEIYLMLKGSKKDSNSLLLTCVQIWGAGAKNTAANFSTTFFYISKLNLWALKIILTFLIALTLQSLSLTTLMWNSDIYCYHFSMTPCRVSRFLTWSLCKLNVHHCSIHWRMNTSGNKKTITYPH